MSISLGELSGNECRTESKTVEHDDPSEPPASGADTLVRVVDTHYTEVDGDNQRPITHLSGRTETGERAWVRVDGHRPRFYVSMDAYDDRGRDLRDDRRVVQCRRANRHALDGTELVRVETTLPTHVADLRDHFERTWEADVRYDQRVLTDLGVTDVVSVPSDSLDGETVSPDDLTSVDTDEIDVDIEPRICYFDIEVRQTEKGPSVVSEDGIERAANEVTAISAYDSYDDQYVLYVLVDESWDVERVRRDLREKMDIDYAIEVFDTEVDLLQSFVGDVTEEWHPDVLTAWNVPFDAPYLVNRCYEQDVYAIRDLSPTGDVRRCNGDGSWLNSSVTGVHVFDLLDGYQKTRYGSLDSYALDAVAEQELDGVQKLDVDEQSAYVEDPVAFCAYSLRDTELLVDLDTAVGII